MLPHATFTNLVMLNTTLLKRTSNAVHVTFIIESSELESQAFQLVTANIIELLGNSVEIQPTKTIIEIPAGASLAPPGFDLKVDFKRLFLNVEFATVALAREFLVELLDVIDS